MSLGGPGRVAHPITGHFYLGSLCCCCGDLIGGSGNGGGGGDGGDGDGDGVAPIPIPLSSLWAARVLPETIDERYAVTLSGVRAGEISQSTAEMFGQTVK